MKPSLLEPQLTVDLAAIRSNWQKLLQRLAPTVECGAVVKANGYGLGAQQVATTLFDEGCRVFYVASLQEALALPSRCLQQGSVVILGGLRPGEEVQCLQSSLVPVLSTVSQLERWSAAVAKFGGAYSSVIKVDTGMHRLGLMPEQLLDLCRNQQELLKSCRPYLLMSQLACAEEPQHSLNQFQLQQFKQVAELIRSFIPSIKLSLANSSGIFLGADYHFDVVRPGASLYGVNPVPGQSANPMDPVVTLRLPIVQVKTVVGPASVGYGATFTIPEHNQCRLAIALGGYGDGIFRYLGNRGYGVIVNQKGMGTKVPLVGRVSMDTAVFDVSGVEKKLSEEVDSITVIGEGIGVDDIAENAGTIGYEILTALGSRYRRAYVHGRCE